MHRCWKRRGFCKMRQDGEAGKCPRSSVAGRVGNPRVKMPINSAERAVSSIRNLIAEGWP
jgi:hypothetical protein